MWNFRKLQRGVPERDPHEDEFFRLKHASDVLIREYIQNALDAKSDKSNKVSVSFSVGNSNKGKMSKYIDDELIKHLKASGIEINNFYKGEIIKYLTIEDFGTTGLDGDTGGENFDRPSERSNFYNFWWCEGKSKKGGHEAGRWGLGKTTFHQASMIRTFLGYTVREDDNKNLLLGKSLLKTHRINSDVFDYSGYYAENNYLPINDTDKIDSFKRLFSIKRNQEPGFSLVILAPDDDIDISSIKRSIIYHYFYAILKGILEIKLFEEPHLNILNKDNIINIAQSLNWNDTEWENTNVVELLNFIKNSIDKKDVAFELKINSGDFPEINKEIFGDNIELIKKKLGEKEIISFKVPIIIREDNNSEQKTFFHILINKPQNIDHAEEYYMRSGIMISGISTLGKRPLRALFIADDLPVVEFLGDAETPSHTEWKENTENFKNKYKNAVKVLRFIKKCILNIIWTIDEPPKEIQRDFLKEIFSIKKERDNNGTGGTKGPNIPETSSKQKLKVHKTEGGFKLSLIDDKVEIPFKAKIKIAYDINRGNPFSHYWEYDFNLSQNDIQIINKGSNVIEKKLNKIAVDIYDKNFNLELKGFDKNRDLIISIKEENL